MIAMPRRNPRALIDLSIEPRLSSDRPKLLASLLETPEITIACADGNESIVVSAPDEVKLDRAVDWLRRTSDVGFHIGAPAVAYLETVLGRGSADYTQKAMDEFARVLIVVEPTDGDLCFSVDAPPGAIEADHVDVVEKATAEALRAGVAAGFPVTRTLVTLRDGAQHPTASTARAFRLAALGAVRAALVNAGSVLLEPLMTLSVRSTSDCADTVMADLRSRRARDLRVERHDGELALLGVAPLANLFGYANTLRAVTQDRATFEMAFARDEIVGGPDDPFEPAAAARA